MSDQITLSKKLRDEQKKYGKSKLTSLSLKLFRHPALFLSKKLPQISVALQKSGNRAPPEHYLAVVMLSTIMSIPFVLTGIIIFSALGMIYGLLLIPLPALVFIVGLMKPWASFSSKGNSIDTELPYVISYFSLLSGGGLSLLLTLRRISRMKLFPVLSKESKRILTDIDLNGFDPVTALDKASRETSNKYLADFLSGYTSLLRAGGKLTSYMDSKIREIFAQRVLKMRSSSGTISLFAEAYIAVTIVMGLCFYLIFTLQAVINQTGFGGLVNAVLFSAVFIPMISVMFFYLVDSVQVRNEPADPFKNLKYVIISLPLLPIAIFLPIDLPIYIKMSMGLIAVSVFPMIKFERESRRKKSVENMLPNFIRDIAEVRKTGLSPERCIQQVAKQDYGRLSKYIRKMSAQISWGIPIRKVMQSFSDSINVWSAKAVTFVLLEVVDLGGGTSKMFENMAEFTQQMKEIAREQVSNLRPLIIVPYFGAVMLIATTLLMMGFLTGASGTEGATSESGIQIALLTGAVGQS